MKNNQQSDSSAIYLLFIPAFLLCLIEMLHYNSYFLRHHDFSLRFLNSQRDNLINSYFIRHNGIFFRLIFILVSLIFIWVVRVLKVKDTPSRTPYYFAGASLLIMLMIKTPYMTVTQPWQLVTVDVFYGLSLFMFPISLMDIKAQSWNVGGFKFRQNQSLIITPLSINWKTRNGNVNVLEPQRGISIIGGAGSGKTFTLVEETIRQLLSKGVTGLIYDFKYPSLAQYAFSVMCRWGWKADEEKSYPWAEGKIRLFYYINFRDIRYSHRCNPLNAKIITNIAMAYECAHTILCNINREWIKKRGFFEDSAIVLLSAILWFNKKYSDRTGNNFSSLPHAIALATMSDDYIIPVLMDDPELKASAAAVASAFTKGAHEQYAGVVATLQNSIGQLNIPEMFYIMTEDSDEMNKPREERISFSLDINNPDDPKIVVLGNYDKMRESFSPALSLYASVISKTINEPRKLPCLFCVDEAPTIYIPHLDNLPNTGRSNGVITTLAAQDYGQYIRDYGKDEARVLNAGLGNIFIGEVGDLETAKFASALFGKREKGKVSTTISSSDVTRNYSTSQEEIFPPDAIMGLNTGEFVGKVTGTPPKARKSKGEDMKLFNSKFLVSKETDPSSKAYDPSFLQELPIVQDLTEDEMRDLLRNTHQQIFEEVEEMVRYELIVVMAKNIWRTTNEVQFKVQDKAGNVRSFIDNQMPAFLDLLNKDRSTFKTEIEAIKGLTKDFFSPFFQQKIEASAN